MPSARNMMSSFYSISLPKKIETIQRVRNENCENHLSRYQCRHNSQATQAVHATFLFVCIKIDSLPGAYGVRGTDANTSTWQKHEFFFFFDLNISATFVFFFADNENLYGDSLKFMAFEYEWLVIFMLFFSPSPSIVACDRRFGALVVV